MKAEISNRKDVYSKSRTFEVSLEIKHASI
uniref:Uncharacterized protein n=1 Tax=Rhizophora mucronata TaxID=61149 RepID=A0A2P2QTH9_RHIMU